MDTLTLTSGCSGNCDGELVRNLLMKRKWQKLENFALETVIVSFSVGFPIAEISSRREEQV